MSLFFNKSLFLFTQLHVCLNIRTHVDAQVYTHMDASHFFFFESSSPVSLHRNFVYINISIYKHGTSL